MTIDNTLSTGGNNYASFKDACDYLALIGSATQEVLFNVTAGQVFLYDSVYLQEFNKEGGETVIFRKYGEGTNPIIQYDEVDEAVIWLDNCQNVVFDGIDVSDPNPTDANYLNTAYYFDNTHNCEIKNANISDFDKYGIYLKSACSNINVDNCELFYTTNFNTSQTTVYVIYSSGTTCTEGINITRNRVYNFKNISSTFYGIRISRASGLVANNFISINKTVDKVYALRFDVLDALQLINAYHNTIVFSADITDDGYAYYGSGALGEVNLKNNILINDANYTGSGTDPQYAFYVGYAGPTYNIENNIYYSNDPSGKLNRWGTTDCNDLATWQATYGGDANSSEILINFTDPATGDLTIADTDLGNVALQGTYVAEVPFDINNQARYCQIPYIGADEADNSFVPLQLVFTTTEASQSIAIPLSVNVDCTVDWGDGSATEDFTTTGEKPHTFADAGTYTVSISGTLEQFGPEGYPFWTGREYLTEVLSFGDVGLESLKYAFIQANNLTSVPSTLPSTVTSLEGTFYQNDQASITNLNLWDVSNVLNMNSMFYGAINFNQNIGSWSVDYVETMRDMFSTANNFNQNISSWDVGNVIDMYRMFNSSAFNQNIGNWDVSAVTNMREMFYSSFGFRIALIIMIVNINILCI